MSQVMPVYRQQLKRSKPTEKNIYCWDTNINQTLLGCLKSTDFYVLFDKNGPIDDNIDVLNSYLHFCIDNSVPMKTIKCYPNNKPWISKEL